MFAVLWRYPPTFGINVAGWAEQKNIFEKQLISEVLSLLTDTSVKVTRCVLITVMFLLLSTVHTYIVRWMSLLTGVIFYVC